MLVAGQISECFGVPWSAIVYLGLQYCTFGTFCTFVTFGTFVTFVTFGTFDLDDLDGLDDLGYLLWSALVYIDLPWSAWAVSDHHRKA